MGVIPSLTVVPAALFKQHQSKLGDLPAPKDAALFDLDKTCIKEARLPFSKRHRDITKTQFRNYEKPIGAPQKMKGHFKSL